MFLFYFVSHFFILDIVLDEQFINLFDDQVMCCLTVTYRLVHLGCWTYKIIQPLTVCDL